MKQISATILIVLLIFLQVRSGLQLVKFELQDKEAAEELCENKDKPELACNGNCVFMKAIKREQEKRNPVPLINLESEISEYIPVIEFINFEINLFDQKKQLNSYYYLPQYSKYLTSIFHPPEMFV